MTERAAGTSEGTPGQQTRSGGPAYRLDLDGLRGVAIGLVVVFHIWFERVSGGVDVFLVLSGYFFTGLLLRRAASGSVGVGATLRRTARRLLPALVTVLAAVVAATVALRPYTQWSDLAAQTLASLFYYQNWRLALSWTNYAAADPSVSPLQHLWSMSVQGQFYLAVTLLVTGLAWLGTRLAKPISPQRLSLVVCGALGLLSFVYAAQASTDHQGWNYYDSFARAWELLAGAVLAVVVPRLALPRIARLALAAAGTVGVLACGWLLDGVRLFPGPAALVPVGAAAALIVAGNTADPDARPLPNRMLASRPLVRLGDIAYALYLWHWPILIFVLTERGRSTAGLGDGLLVIAVSLAAAWATHRFVEQPLRLRTDPPPASAAYRRRAGAAVTAAGSAVAVLAAVWLVVVSANPPRPVGTLDSTAYPGAETLAAGVGAPEAPMRPSIAEAPADRAYPARDGCIADFDTRDVVTCTYGRPDARRTLAVAGSSHAEHWIPALQVLADQHDFRIDVYLKMGCPLTVAAEPMYKGERIPDCRDWSRDVIDRLGVERPDWVFTTGTRPRDTTGDETPADYVDVWSELADRGLNVVAVRDTPWLRRNGIRYRAIDCLAQGGDRTSCGMPRAEALDPVDPAEAPAAGHPTVFPIDLSNAVCEPLVCPVVAGNVLLYHDEHHLTATYSRSLAPELERQLRPILGWW
ncbi:peptidoglycan/LPS O-acetylase OafA/YrhL [Nocardia transvalensis]|uniref:Peptidoglycan/LPS O-acetylase OafA/YrhL n=1 Tax=Nocardia transvalensis TaxID=37333 RepID=A0A7W9PKZ4_9NOCA|nr:acyltransferase family protein [Nocardia transvalensis]MBB5917534.1 peptidoglycan/LPS O-acetylase OafA/YrhL [Nocardia transvalensis]